MSKKKAKKAKKKLQKKVKKRGENLEIPEEIEDKEQFQELSDKVVQIKKAKKHIEEKKNHYSKPFLETYRTVRDYFTPMIDQLDNWEDEIKDVLGEYTKKVNKKIEEENKEKREQAKEESDETKIKVQQKEKLKEQKSKDGKVQSREKVDYEVTDKSKLPPEFTKVKVKKRELRKAIKDGEDIPGVEVEKSYNPAIYTSND